MWQGNCKLICVPIVGVVGSYWPAFQTRWTIQGRICRVGCPKPILQIHFLSSLLFPASDGLLPDHQALEPVALFWRIGWDALSSGWLLVCAIPSAYMTLVYEIHYFPLRSTVDTVGFFHHFVWSSQESLFPGPEFMHLMAEFLTIWILQCVVAFSTILFADASASVSPFPWCRRLLSARATDVVVLGLHSSSLGGMKHIYPERTWGWCSIGSAGYQGSTQGKI